MSIGNFPESLGQAMLVGVMLVGRLGVPIFPVEVRCYIFVKMSRTKRPMWHHVTPHLRCLFVHVSRETPDVTPCHTSPPRGVAPKPGGALPLAGVPLQDFLKSRILENRESTQDPSITCFIFCCFFMFLNISQVFAILLYMCLARF